MKHEDVCTLLRNEEDKDILTRKLFDVNMRLLKSSSAYKDIVFGCCEYIKLLATTERKGYKKPHGYSGANAGIPFNIIALADGTVMINPVVVPIQRNGPGLAIKDSLSNCGSLLLNKPIKIWRWADIYVEYFDINGNKTIKYGYLPTVQHEVDHNNGVLITDRQVKE